MGPFAEEETGEALPTRCVIEGIRPKLENLQTQSHLDCDLIHNADIWNPNQYAASSPHSWQTLQYAEETTVFVTSPNDRTRTYFYSVLNGFCAARRADFIEGLDPYLECAWATQGCMNSAATNYNQEADFEIEGECKFATTKCLDSHAINYYNPAQQTSEIVLVNGGCTYTRNGCTDVDATNFDSLANTDEGCTYPKKGCTDSRAVNFESGASIDSQTCFIPTIGCRLDFATNYDANANTGCPNCCVIESPGCTHSRSSDFRTVRVPSSKSFVQPVATPPLKSMPPCSHAV